MDKNNTANKHASPGHPDSGVADTHAGQKRESLLGPRSVVIDLSQAMNDFRRNTKYLRRSVDPEDVLKYLSREITSKDYDADAVFDFISDVRFNNEDRLMPNEMKCLADAIEKLGMALVERLRQHNIFNPETGRFEYGFFGFATESMAVFRSLMLNDG